ncbi:murein biosynthesis integral membrane protein MurJ [Candidatus Gottesmanbacteria bacterium]|nr:murein biosynthesis integral membrane protein MurJ [Candidatus Gottesmanbacteria bacterium]
MKQIFSFFSRKQATIGSAAFVLMSMVLASRVLGLFRDRLLASYFSPDELGVYFAAFRVPNMIFELLVMGALTSAFIPVFTKYKSEHGESGAWHMTSSLINVSLVAFALFALPFFLWTREISRFLAPGFSPVELEQMVVFTRFMMVGQVIPLLIGNFFTGILQSYNLFLIPAIAPVVYNIGIIIGTIILYPAFGLFAPVYGVGIGALFFMLIQIPLLFSIGFRYKAVLDVKNHGVREVGRLMAPRTLGLAISQIDTTVDLMLASILGAKMVTVFNFAQHLQQLPIGLFGATIAQAALPSLSQSSVNENKEQFRQAIISSLHQVFFFVFPSTVFFIVLRIPIVRLVFGASRFDWEATSLTGLTLAAFSVSLFAQAAVHVLARGFYALYDTKTPVVIGVICIVVNSLLSLYFIQFLGYPVWSLGVSTSVASIINGILLFWYLNKKLTGISTFEFYTPTIKMFIVSVITGVMLYIPLKLLDQLVFDTTRAFPLFFLTGVVGGIGTLTYIFLSWVFGITQVQSVFAFIQRMKKPLVFLEPASEAVDAGIQDTIS